jgi:microcystin-dependent protein
VAVTHNYGWTLPTVHADNSTWGAELNTTIGAIDGQVYTNQQAVVAVQGQLNANGLTLARNAASAATLTFINSLAPANQQVRWMVYGCDGANETGSNAGSNFDIIAFSDTGASLGSALAINRQTQRVSVTQSPAAASDVANKGYVDHVVSPVGAIVMWATPTPPPNWTWCSGGAVSRTTYSALFAVLGTAYGAGDGSTTFNLPNMFGRMPMGYDNGAWAMGATGGEQNHTLTQAEMPVHGHVDSGHAHTITDPQHSHTLQGSMGGGVGGVSPPTVHNSAAGTAPVTNPASTGITQTNAAVALIQNSGGGAAHNNMPPYFVIGFIIRLS